MHSNIFHNGLHQVSWLSINEFLEVVSSSNIYRRQSVSLRTVRAFTLPKSPSHLATCITLKSSIVIWSRRTCSWVGTAISWWQISGSLAFGKMKKTRILSVARQNTSVRIYTFGDLFSTRDDRGDWSRFHFGLVGPRGPHLRNDRRRAALF